MEIKSYVFSHTSSSKKLYYGCKKLFDFFGKFYFSFCKSVSFFALAIINGLVCLLSPFFGFFYSQTLGFFLSEMVEKSKNNMRSLCDLVSFVQLKKLYKPEDCKFAKNITSGKVFFNCAIHKLYKSYNWKTWKTFFKLCNCTIIISTFF